MIYKVETVAPFRKEAKKLIKKYSSLKNELAELGLQLSENPTTGISIGNNCYKIRIIHKLAQIIAQIPQISPRKIKV